MSWLTNPEGKPDNRPKDPSTPTLQVLDPSGIQPGRKVEDKTSNRPFLAYVASTSHETALLINVVISNISKKDKQRMMLGSSATKPAMRRLLEERKLERPSEIPLTKKRLAVLDCSSSSSSH